jgi:hypothetical protein
VLSLWLLLRAFRKLRRYDEMISTLRKRNPALRDVVE